MDRWNDLLAIGKRNNDTVTIHDVKSCEIPMRTFRDNARRVGWPQLHSFVWGLPGSADTYDRQLMAAVRALHGPALLTGESVLWLHGVLTARPAQVHVLLPPNRHHAPMDGVRFFRGRWLSGDEPERRFGYHVAPLMRSLTDASPLRSADQLTRDIATIDRLRLGSLVDAVVYAERRGRFPGCGGLAEAIARLGIETTHSNAEKVGRKALRAIGLHPASRPFEVTEAGIRLAEIDIAFPPALYGIEVDGPHHMLVEVAQADKVRDRGLEQRDWRIDRFTTDEVERNPGAFAAQVRQGLLACAKRLALSPQTLHSMVTIGE